MLVLELLSYRLDHLLSHSIAKDFWHLDGTMRLHWVSHNFKSPLRCMPTCKARFRDKIPDTALYETLFFQISESLFFSEANIHGNSISCKLLSSLSPADPKSCFPFIADGEFTGCLSWIMASFLKRKNELWLSDRRTELLLPRRLKLKQISASHQWKR